MRFLLDTNIVSDLIRHPQRRMARRITEIGEEQVCTSIVVAAELRYGAARKGSERLSAQVEAVLGAIDVLALEAPADRVYGEIRATLERTGLSIGANDLLIAAQAVALGLTLVTDNEREFGRVTGLSIENWLRREMTARLPGSSSERGGAAGSQVRAASSTTSTAPPIASCSTTTHRHPPHERSDLSRCHLRAPVHHHLRSWRCIVDSRIHCGG